MFSKIYTLFQFQLKNRLIFHEILWFDMYVYQHNIMNSDVMKYY
jgi:hypothetical protein